MNCTAMVAFSRYRWKTSEQPSVISLYACLNSNSRKVDSVGVRRRGIASRSMFIFPSFVCVAFSSQSANEGKLEATRDGTEDGTSDRVGREVGRAEGKCDGCVVGDEVGMWLGFVVGMPVGLALSVIVGVMVGRRVGERLGGELGELLGREVVGYDDGMSVGLMLGACENDGRRVGA